jgi:hypothetical protein
MQFELLIKLQIKCSFNPRTPNIGIAKSRLEGSDIKKTKCLLTPNGLDGAAGPAFANP